ncbi:MAG: hypothetical protein QOG62_2321 [Thermoleophilaceae bacterium]|nr:hypothetical protein [Thermoleophilaceae bacterium]
MTRTHDSTAPGLPGYSPDSSPFVDEALDAGGSAALIYREMFTALEGADLAALGRAVQEQVDSVGAEFGSGPTRQPFPVDAVPRVVDGSEWDALAAGAGQRVRALNAFIADVYGDRRIVTEGVMPARVLEAADHLDAGMAGAPPIGVARAPMAGLDVVRGADGSLQVLEDNLRTPSGITYLAAAREALDNALPLPAPSGRRSLADSFTAMRSCIDDARGDLEGEVVLLSDGPSNSAWYEHQTLAARLGLPLITPDALHAEAGHLNAAIDGEEVRLAVIYRRMDEDRLVGLDGNATTLGLMVGDARRAGNVAFVDDFGTGVGDDKLVHGYVEDMVRFYLGQEPLLRSVPTFDLEREGALEEVVSRIDEMVIKPRTGHGGKGIVVCAHAQREDVEAAVAAITAHPDRYVAQPMVSISRHPTVIDGRLAPRHVDLRVFVFTDAEGEHVVPGGLTRVALGEGALVVNSSQQGGGKDTWVVD